ncbi:uncharacterized protein LOC144887145 [Branchiostoma floridae x Branchiostoma japonicum]
MVMEVYVTNDENTWLKQDEYVPLGVGLDPDDPDAVPKIPDLHMTASSRRDEFFPWLARLNNGRGQQLEACWSPYGQEELWNWWSPLEPENRFDQWLQIEHDKIYKVAGVITQGAYNADYWVTAYKLAFSLYGQRWTTYTNVIGDGEEVVSTKSENRNLHEPSQYCVTLVNMIQLFQGNSDNHRYARNLLPIPVFALYTRFYPDLGEWPLRRWSGCAAHEVPCNDACRPKQSLCRAFEGCVPHRYNDGEDVYCEEVLETECGLESGLGLEDLGCLEIDSQFLPCGDDVSPGNDVFHDRQACDGREDCSTGKDEDNCDDCAMECSTVLGDPCVPGHWICDGIDDCADGEDEQACVYGVPKHCFFTCRHNVTCLPSRQLGDGRQDCADGEDERPGDVEEALGREWVSCSYSCPSVYGNASCVPDACWCDGDADCLGEEDEQGCVLAAPVEDDGETGDGGSTGGQEATTGPTGGQEATEGSTGDQGAQQEPSAEPTRGQGSFEDNTVGEFHARSCGAQNQAVVWMTAAALGGQILYRLAF